MKFRIGTVMIVRQDNGREAVVVVTNAKGDAWWGTIPVIDKHTTGHRTQITSIIRY